MQIVLTVLIVFGIKVILSPGVHSCFPASIYCSKVRNVVDTDWIK